MFWINYKEELGYFLS